MLCHQYAPANSKCVSLHSREVQQFRYTALIRFRNLNKLSDKRLHARLALSEGRTENSYKEQQLLLKDVKDKLEENNKQIRAGNAVTLKISETLRLDWIRRLGSELKTFMRKIFVMNVATYKAVLDIRRCLPSHLERSLYQEPFILEDAIGRIAPVHMQFISSREAFDAVLELRFHSTLYAPSSSSISCTAANVEVFILRLSYSEDMSPHLFNCSFMEALTLTVQTCRVIRWF